MILPIIHPRLNIWVRPKRRESLGPSNMQMEFGIRAVPEFGFLVQSILFASVVSALRLVKGRILVSSVCLSVFLHWMDLALSAS